MPGQEKMIFDYYQKNPSATQHLKRRDIRRKIIDLFKSKVKSQIKTISIKEAEKIIMKFNENIKSKTITKSRQKTKINLK